MEETLLRLSEVIITSQIIERKSRGYTHAFDAAYQALVDKVENDEEPALQAICDTARDFCNAESAGMSLFGYINEEPVFNWEVASGRAASMAGKVYSPRDNTPCGTVLEMYSYQVFCHPERHYRWAKENGFVIPEMITMPIYKDDMRPLGTFWLMHAEGNHFDQEDIRIISVLLPLSNKALKKRALSKALTFS